MSKNPLFSTYRQGENRVTSSMVAVFERIDLSLLERLLAAASGESTLEMVTFSNQPAGKGASIPDARISARFSFWFEVKTTRNAVDRTQLEEHLKNLDDDSSQERLFVVTPDAAEPPTVEAINDRRIIWFNFASLADAIDAAISDQAEPVADQARFLLRELRSLLAQDGLIDNDEVVVMAARAAYPEYLAHHVYVCQPGRTFRDGLTHLGFYAEKAIQPHVARILFGKMLSSSRPRKRHVGAMLAACSKGGSLRQLTCCSRTVPAGWARAIKSSCFQDRTKLRPSSFPVLSSTHRPASQAARLHGQWGSGPRALRASRSLGSRAPTSSARRSRRVLALPPTTRGCCWPEGHLSARRGS